MNYIVLGGNIRAARRAAGFTQEDASRVLNVARTTIVAIEKGQRRVTSVELDALSKWLDMPLDDLTVNADRQMDLLRGSMTLQGNGGDTDRHYAFLTDDEADLLNAVRHGRWFEAVEWLVEQSHQRAEVE